MIPITSVNYYNSEYNNDHQNYQNNNNNNDNNNSNNQNQIDRTITVTRINTIRRMEQLHRRNVESNMRQEPETPPKHRKSDKKTFVKGDIFYLICKYGFVLFLMTMIVSMIAMMLVPNSKAKELERTTMCNQTADLYTHVSQFEMMCITRPCLSRDRIAKEIHVSVDATKRMLQKYSGQHSLFSEHVRIMDMIDQAHENPGKVKELIVEWNSKITSQRSKENNDEEYNQYLEEIDENMNYIHRLSKELADCDVGICPKYHVYFDAKRCLVDLGKELKCESVDSDIQLNHPSHTHESLYQTNSRYGKDSCEKIIGSVFNNKNDEKVRLFFSNVYGK